MTTKELTEEFHNFIKEDREWKKKVEPILTDYNNKQVINRFLGSSKTALLAVLGALATLGLVVHYVIQPLMNWLTGKGWQ